MEIIDYIYSLQILDVPPVLQGYVRCLSIPRLIYREGAEPRVHFEVSSETVDTTLCVVSICTTRSTSVRSTQPVRRIVCLAQYATSNLPKTSVPEKLRT
jgi:hypothetical protein